MRSDAAGDYSPFGIQSIGKWVVVSYAKREPGSSDETDGAGLGFVDVYTQNGRWSPAWPATAR